MINRKIITLITSLFFFIIVQAQVTKTINVTTAGTLSKLLTSDELSTITDLTVTGNINQSDISTMNTWMPSLVRIDISETTIKAYSDGLTNYPENEIPIWAFYSCQRLKSIKLPKTITAIGDLAFEYCYGLTGPLIIPPSVKRIGEHAFAYCNFTGTLTIPSSVTTIGTEAFRLCKGFTGSLIIPSSVTSIGGSAFELCSGLIGSLTIPSSVTTIGYGAFKDCTGFNGSLSIPSSIKTIESGTFQGCLGFTGSLSIPSSVINIKNGAFEYCYGFTGSLSIPSSVTTIGESAFYGCSGFTGSLSIPSSVTNIGNGAFEYCSGFTSLSIPASLTTINDYVFYGFTGLVGSLIIPPTITSIGNKSFLGCRNLSSITIPESVTTIKNEAFEKCSALKRIFLYGNDPTKINLGSSVFWEVPINTCYLHVPVGKKALYAAAVQWNSFANIIEGYATVSALTITTPTVVTNKMVDGNTNAAITKPGTLQGVDATDAYNVGVTATATYDNASVGTNKTITVVYTLTGSAKDKYITPANYVITTGKISDYITLAPLSIPTPGCEGLYLDLPYTLRTGTPTQYKITFNSEALNAGVKNITYTTLPNTGSSGILSIPIPVNTKDGTYQGTLKMKNELDVESTDYPFTFTINVSADNILTKFDDVVLFNNFSKRFTGYQWYKNGVEIAGATKQFYSDPNGLVGSYSLKLTTTDGKTLYSCEKDLNIPSSKVGVSTFPNPVKANASFTVQLKGVNCEELKAAKLSVYDMQGICVYESGEVNNINKLDLPVSGAYIGHITTSVSDYMFKIIVIK